MHHAQHSIYHQRRIPCVQLFGLCGGHRNVIFTSFRWNTAYPNLFENKIFSNKFPELSHFAVQCCGWLFCFNFYWIGSPIPSTIYHICFTTSIHFSLNIFIQSQYIIYNLHVRYCVSCTMVSQQSQQYTRHWLLFEVCARNTTWIGNWRFVHV